MKYILNIFHAIVLFIFISSSLIYAQSSCISTVSSFSNKITAPLIKEVPIFLSSGCADIDTLIVDPNKTYLLKSIAGNTYFNVESLEGSLLISGFDSLTITPGLLNIESLISITEDSCYCTPSPDGYLSNAKYIIQCIDCECPIETYETCNTAYPINVSNGDNCTLSDTLYSSCGNYTYFQFTTNYEELFYDITHIYGDHSYETTLYLDGCDGPFPIIYDDSNATISGLTIGETYTLRIKNISEDVFSVFRLCLTNKLPPPNNLCETANNFIVNLNELFCTASNRFSIGNATNTLDEEGCYFQNGQAGDIWFMFTPSNYKDLIKITPKNATDDFGLEVYSGSCNNLYKVDCDYNQQYHFYSGLQDQTHYVRIIGNINSEFDLCFSELNLPTPSNNECILPNRITSLYEDYSYTEFYSPQIINEYGTQSLIACDHSTNADDELWYQFTATSSVQIIFIGNVTTPIGEGTEYSIDFYQDGCFSEVKHCFKSYGYAGKAFIIDQLDTGIDYCFRVYSDNNNSILSYDLGVGSPPSITNDECDGAIMLNTNSSLYCIDYYQGTTEGSSTSINDLENASFEITQDVWYEFVATNNSHVINFTNVNKKFSSGTTDYLAIAVYDDCENSALVSQSFRNASSLLNGIHYKVDNLSIGERYKVRIGTEGINYWNYDICILTSPNGPSNDKCNNATILNPSNQNQPNFINGTTFYSTEDEIESTDQNRPNVWYHFDAKASNYTLSFKNILESEFLEEDGQSLIIDVYNGDCGNLQLVTNTYSDVLSLSNLSIGDTYFISISSLPTQTFFNFEIALTSDDIPIDVPQIINLPPTNYGYTPGKFNVDPRGGANYGIPLVIPSGSSGMKPQLSINYNSSAGNGILGNKFQLGGLSLISRVGRSHDHEGEQSSPDFSSKDRFALNGERLVQWSTGQYGEHGMEYKTENNNFSRIISYGEIRNSGCPKYFKMWTKDGLIYEYGASEDSRIEGRGRSEISNWLLTKIKDTNGNEINFEYIEDVGYGYYYPYKINYSSNPNLGITPQYEIRFVYEDRPDIEQYFLCGSKTSIQKRMKQIAIYHESGTNVRSYTFDYNLNALSGKSEMKLLQECGLNGDCLNPTTFNWQESVDAFENLNITTHVNKIPTDSLRYTLELIPHLVEVDELTENTWFYKRITTTYQKFVEVKFGLLAQSKNISGDMDGDGLNDIIIHKSVENRLEFYKNNGDYNFEKTPFIKNIPFSFIDSRELHALDYNGDSFLDFFFVDTITGANLLYLNNGDFNEYNTFTFGFHEYQNIIHPSYLAKGSSGKKTLSIIDYNADALPDFTIVSEKDDNYRIVLLHKSASLELTLDNVDIPQELYEDKQYFFDFNTDGLVDVIRYNTDTKENFWYQNTSTNTSISYKLVRTNAISPAFLPFSFQLKAADFNGDGTTDLLLYSGTENGINYTYKPKVLINHGCLIFREKKNWSLLTLQGTPNPLDIVFAPYDINGDGAADLVTYINDGGLLYFQINKGDGTFYNEDYEQIIYQPIDTSEISGGFGLSFVNHRAGSLLALKWSNKGVKNTTQKIFDFGGNSKMTDLTSIIEGSGQITSIDYEYCSKKEIYERDTSPNEYNSYPYLDYAGDMKVVSNYHITSVDSPTKIISKSFHYKYGKVNVDGRGFNGFGQFIEIDNNRGITKQIGLHTNSKYKSSTVAFERNQLSDGTFTLFKINQSQVDTLVGPSGNKVFNVYVPKTTTTSNEINGSSISKTIQEIKMDDYGNAIFQSIDYGNGYKDITYNEFDDDLDNWYLGRVSKTEIHRTKEDEPSIIRVAEFEYDNETGQLIKEISDPEFPLFKKTKEYVRDSFGNIVESKTTAWNGVEYETRSIQTLFDSIGRFNIEKRNDLGHVTKQKYDPIQGLMVAKVDLNNLETTYEYDGLGRQILATQPNGTWNQTIYAKCNGIGADCAFSSLAYIQQISNVNPTTTRFYDDHSREVRKTTYGFDNKLVVQSSTYDALGRLAAESDPYFPQSSGGIRRTYYEYDILDRPTKVTKPGNVVSQVRYDGLHTVYINPLGQERNIWKSADGRIETVIDDIANTIEYEYDLQQNTTAIHVKNSGTLHTITSEFDLVGNKTKMDDPDMGVYQYTSNRFKELIQQTYPSGKTVDMKYDQLGRTTQKNEEEGSTSYIYDIAENGIGQLAQTTSFAFSSSFQYDSLSRLQIENQTIENNTYSLSYEYDSLGRVHKYHYPEALTLRYQYDEQNFLRKIVNDDSNLIYYELEEADALGLIHKERLGNGVKTENIFDLDKKHLIGRKANNAGVVIQDLSFEYDDLQNLTKRTNHYRNYEENFDYDILNRLIQYSIPGLDTTNVEYDNFGNIQYKSDVGFYFYGENNAGPNQLTRIEPIDKMSCVPPSLEAQYDFTSFNKVRSISNDSLRIELQYGDARQRIIQQTFKKDSLIEKKTYIGSAMEIVEDGNTQSTKLLYIRNAEGVFAVLTISGTTQTTDYWHKDHLGSLQTVTNDEGSFVEDLAYDPWGLRRNAEDGSKLALTIDPKVQFDRGYTGHEHIDLFRLINMNGRIHDPVLGRFISPDPYIQEPTNAQNYNRYSYVWNNPLRFTDPSGYMGFDPGTYENLTVTATGKDGNYTVTGKLIALDDFHTSVQRVPNGFSKLFNAVTTAVLSPYLSPAGAAFISSLATNVLAGQSFNASFKAATMSALYAGVSAAASTYVGDLVGKIGNPIAMYSTKIVAHGIVQGGMAELQGGDFIHGFAAGAGAGAVSIGTNAAIKNGIFERGGPTNYIVAGVGAGSVSSITGGDFGNGFVTGVIIEFYNNNGPASEERRKRELKRKKSTSLGIGTSDIASEIAVEGATESLRSSSLKAGAKAIGAAGTVLTTTADAVTEFNNISHDGSLGDAAGVFLKAAVIPVSLTFSLAGGLPGALIIAPAAAYILNTSGDYLINNN